MHLHTNFQPTVSIVSPTYNRASYLERAINSVLNQSYSQWELIIVDDGSIDKTYEIVNDYLQKYDNIRYIKHSNRKVTLTKNAGILAACGQYITFLDSDDEYKKNHLQLRVDFMAKNSHIDLIHGGCDIIGNQYVQDRNDLSKKIHLNECIIGGTFFGKKELFLEIGGFNNLAYSSESNLYERAQQKYAIQKVDWNTYVYYRDTPGSICNTISKKQAQQQSL